MGKKGAARTAKWRNQTCVEDDGTGQNSEHSESLGRTLGIFWQSINSFQHVSHASFFADCSTLGEPVWRLLALRVVKPEFMIRGI